MAATDSRQLLPPSGPARTEGLSPKKVHFIGENASHRCLKKGDASKHKNAGERESEAPAEQLTMRFGLCLGIAMFFGCDQDKRTSPMSLNRETQSQEIEKGTPELAPPQTSGQEIMAPSTPSRKVRLQIDVSGFENNEGNCRIAIYRNQPHFNDPEYAIAKESVSILKLKAVWQVELDVPENSGSDAKTPIRLAVSAFHDANTNTKLDKNSFGIPTERYGFSKNPKRGFGPPKFIETALELEASDAGRDSSLVLEIPIQIK